MKKAMIFCLVFALAMTGLTGCAATKSSQTKVNESIAMESAESKKPEVHTKTSKMPEDCGAIRKAAEESGYNVYDEHQLVFLSEVKEGFSVEITADGQNTVYSFVECETEEAAIKNAKYINDAGYNIAIHRGRFLTCYAVDKKDGKIKDILAALLEGQSVDKKLYDGSIAEQALIQDSGAQTAGTINPVPSKTAETIAGTWASGAISGQYNNKSGKFEDVSGMGLIYVFYEDKTFAQLVVLGNYIITTGQYSVS